MCKSAIKRLKCKKCHNLFYEELVKPCYVRHNSEQYWICPLCRGILDNYDSFDDNVLNNYYSQVSQLKEYIKKELKAKYSKDAINIEDNDYLLLYFTLKEYEFKLFLYPTSLGLAYSGRDGDSEDDVDINSFEQIFSIIDDVIKGDC